MKKLSVVVLGAGIRGLMYTNLMADMPDKYDVVAVLPSDEISHP